MSGLTARARLLVATVASVFVVVCGSTVPAPADTRLFRSGKWTVDGAADTAPNRRDIKISVGGQPAGNFSELKLFHDIAGGAPQVFSVKGSGALRPVLPTPGQFGGTFYATGYWDCERGFLQNTAITELNILIDPDDPGVLRLTGKASNLSSFEASDFTLRFLPSSMASVKVEVSYTLVATTTICVDEMRQGQREGFRIARIASNFLSSEIHDSDQAQYLSTPRKVVCENLKNNGRFMFSSPLAMAGTTLSLVHTRAVPRTTPTLHLTFREPVPGQITPRGFVAASSDSNDDNVDLWANWDGAKSTYVAGATIGRFDYTLEAIPPHALPGAVIGINQLAYRAGDRMMVSVTTEPCSASDRWFLVVALVTPVNTPADPFFIFRFDPVVELISLKSALARPSFSDVAARPLKAVTVESFVILDVPLPSLPTGSYQWLAALLSEDLSVLSTVAIAPFTFE